MKKLTTAIFLAFAVLMQVHAQDPNPKVTAGSIAFNAGRYDEAIEKFNQALDNAAELKAKNVTKLHYNLSQSYLRVAQDPELADKYPNAALLASEQLTLADKADNRGTKYDGKFKVQITLAKEQMWPAVFNAGAAKYNEEEYESSKEHFMIATSLNESDPLSHMMLGYSCFMLEDTTCAVDSWSKSTEAYAANPPDSANANMESCYLLLSSVLDMKGETRKALEKVTEGRKFFPQSEDLQRTELSIYQQHPDLFVEAEEKFKTAISQNPDDHRLKLAYATLLQQQETPEQEKMALDLYHQVLKSDPKNVPANLQIGAFFVNKAAELNEAKMNLDDDAGIAAKELEIKDNLKQAYPYIKLLHEEQPEEAEWINQLVNITLYLDMEEEANEYVKKQQEVMAKQNSEN